MWQHHGKHCTDVEPSSHCNNSVMWAPLLSHFTKKEPKSQSSYFVQGFTDNKWESQDSVAGSLVPKSDFSPLSFKVILSMRIILFFCESKKCLISIIEQKIKNIFQVFHF